MAKKRGAKAVTAVKEWDGEERRLSGYVDRRGDPRSVQPFQEYPKMVDGVTHQSAKAEAAHARSGKPPKAEKVKKVKKARKAGRKK